MKSAAGLSLQCLPSRVRASQVSPCRKRGRSLISGMSISAAVRAVASFRACTGPEHGWPEVTPPQKRKTAIHLASSMGVEAVVRLALLGVHVQRLARVVESPHPHGAHSKQRLYLPLRLHLLLPLHLHGIPSALRLNGYFAFVFRRRGDNPRWRLPLSVRRSSGEAALCTAAPAVPAANPRRKSLSVSTLPRLRRVAVQRSASPVTSATRRPWACGALRARQGTSVGPGSGHRTRGVTATRAACPPRSSRRSCSRIPPPPRRRRAPGGPGPLPAGQARARVCGAPPAGNAPTPEPG